MHRHPHHTKRPTFEETLRPLLDSEETVLDIPSEDSDTHKDAACLGAELQAGHKMYTNLQALYIPSSTSISQRPSGTTAVKIRPNREPSYESVDITHEEEEDDEEEIPSYLNVHQSLIRQSEEVGDNDERYKNILSTSARNTVVEAIYDKINFSTPEAVIESVRNKEDYYNVVAVREDEIYTDTITVQTPSSELNTPLQLSSTVTETTHRKEKPPLKPKPAPRNIKYTPAATNDVNEIDYYEKGEDSILTINNDQLVV